MVKDHAIHPLVWPLGFKRKGRTAAKDVVPIPIPRGERLNNLRQDGAMSLVLTRRLKRYNAGNASNSRHPNNWAGNRRNWLTRIECRVYFPPVLIGAPSLRLRCDYEKFL